MMAIKFKANAFHVEVEEDKVILEAAVQTLCGKVVDYIDIYLPLSFKKHFTELVNPTAHENEEDLSDLKEIYLKRQNYRN